MAEGVTSGGTFERACECTAGMFTINILPGLGGDDNVQVGGGMVRWNPRHGGSLSRTSPPSTT